MAAVANKRYLVFAAAIIPTAAHAHGDPRYFIIPVAIIGMLVWLGNGFLARRVFPAAGRTPVFICLAIGAITSALTAIGNPVGLIFGAPLSLITALLLLLGLPRKS